MIEHLEIDDYKMGAGGSMPYNGDPETSMAMREQLYAQMMGWA